ncbi:MAG: hypothetical protein ACLR0U_04175 [Enterocloster clostridioformis]
MEDDTEDSTVGVKDGEALLLRCGLKKITKLILHSYLPTQYILFIGHNKLIKEKSSHMKVAFSQYGMAYGWLGKQAVLCVNKVVSAKYNDFITFALSYQDDLEKLIKERRKIKKQQNIKSRCKGSRCCCFGCCRRSFSCCSVSQVDIVKSSLNKRLRTTV